MDENTKKTLEAVNKRIDEMEQNEKDLGKMGKEELYSKWTTLRKQGAALSVEDIRTLASPATDSKFPKLVHTTIEFVLNTMTARDGKLLFLIENHEERNRCEFNLQYHLQCEENELLRKQIKSLEERIEKLES